MKKTFFIFLLISLLGSLKIQAQDNATVAAGWNIIAFSEGGEMMELPGNILGSIYVQDDDVYFSLLDGDNEMMLDLYAVVNVSYTGPEKVEDINFDSFECLTVSADEEEGIIRILFNRDSDEDIMFVAMASDQIFYLGEQIIPNAVARMKKLGALMTDDNRKYSIATLLTQSFGD